MKGYCRLAYNKGDGTLWMLGGRLGYTQNENLKSDIWSFNFVTCKWTKAGRTNFPDDSYLVGDVIIDNKWYIVLVGTGGTCKTSYYNLKTNAWHSVKTNDAPTTLRKDEYSHWFYDGILYLYGGEDNERVFAGEATMLNRSMFFGL